MTQEIIQTQVHTGDEKPASRKFAQPSQNQAANKAAMVDLSDADLQAVTGGGGKGGMGGEF